MKADGDEAGLSPSRQGAEGARSGSTDDKEEGLVQLKARAPFVRTLPLIQLACRKNPASFPGMKRRRAGERPSRSIARIHNARPDRTADEHQRGGAPTDQGVRRPDGGGSESGGLERGGGGRAVTACDGGAEMRGWLVIARSDGRESDGMLVRGK